MTPIERIRQSREMVQLSKQIAKPSLVTQPFPRNSTALAVVAFMVMPLIYKAIMEPSAANVMGYGLGSAIISLGVFSIATGQRYHAIYDGKFVARASAIPFKALGAGALALAAAGLTAFQGGTLLQAMAVFPVVTALSLLAFGLDPLKNKGLETADERHTYKLEKLAAGVGAQMDRIKKSAAPLAVPEVMDEISAFDAAVNDLLCAVTSDPARANSVRKYFTVYLEGAADASERFAAVYRRAGTRQTRDDYVAVLQKLTRVFSAKSTEYASAGGDMLDVEIKVLDDYLARESAAA